MTRGMKFTLVLFMGLGCLSGTLRGQSVKGGMEDFQDSLVSLGYTIYNEPSEPERLKANFAFVKTLVSALRTPGSYHFPFDSLSMVSILRAPDDRFRVFSWHVPLNDGSYLYYGTIQLNTPDGSLKMFPLLDKTYEIKSPETAVTTPSDWYGAQYYRIVPLGKDYLLLGWKGHTARVTQKVIEVLRFEGSDLKLGKEVFDSDSTRGHTRIIYRLSQNARMYLDYDRAGDRIVMDHLAPPDERDSGLYEYYGPDLTYDTWQLKGTRAVLVRDIPLANSESPQDDLYNDPRKPYRHPKSGFSPQ